MRKFLLIFALLTGAALAQTFPSPPDCVIAFGFNAAGRSSAFDNRQPTAGCTTWHLIFSNAGFSADSVEIDEAPDTTTLNTPGSWATWPSTQTASGSQPLTSTTGGQVTVFGFYPWVSVNLNSKTGTGAVSGFAYGYKSRWDQDANAVPGGVFYPNIVGTSDPCMNPNILKQTAIINQAATTQEIVATSGSTTVYVCNGAIEVSGTTTPTAQFKTGTKVTNPCDTGAVTLTGPFDGFSGNAAVIPIGNGGGMAFKSSAGGEICVTGGGTGPSIKGWIAYVQQ